MFVADARRRGAVSARSTGQVGSMRQCPSCGFTTDSGELTWTICGRRLPLNLGFTEITWRKIGLALLIPFLIYIVMTTLLR